MKEYDCVQVAHHNKIGETIEKALEHEWQLHTYQAVCDNVMTGRVVHYLLFEKGED